MITPEILGYSPRDVKVPYALDPIYENYGQGEVDSLLAYYDGYILASIQVSYPDLMPFQIDGDDYIDQLLSTWPGLPLTDKSPRYEPPADLTVHYVPTDPGAAGIDMKCFNKAIDQLVLSAGFNSTERWRVFATQMRDILISPPDGLMVVESVWQRFWQILPSRLV
jgi:hypothetical protein